MIPGGETFKKDNKEHKAAHATGDWSIEAWHRERERERESTATMSFQKALDSWTQIHFPQVQQSLDTSLESITQLQQSTLESRKNLSAKTKEYKKLTDDAKLVEWKSLLKLYQMEVDSLTERAKKSEGVIVECYKSLGELPDPTPLLEVSIESVLVAEEVATLKLENDRLKEDAVKYADYEQLKDKLVMMQQQQAEQLNNKLKSKQEELESGFKEKERQWTEKEEDLKSTIDSLKSEVLELKTQGEVMGLKLKNQRIALGEDFDEVDPVVNVSKDDKLVALLKDEVSSKESRITNLEKRNESLIKELSVAKSEMELQDKKLEKELKLVELERENATLVMKLDMVSQKSDTVAKSFNKKINALQQQLVKNQEEYISLKKKLATMSDYDQLKSEISMLKAIQFGDMDSDSDDESEDPVKSTHGLDEILVTRNKKLMDELVEYRQRHSNLTSTIEQLQSQHSSQTRELEQVKSLNVQLENEMLAIQGANSRYDTMSMISGVTKNTNSMHKPRRLSPASSIAGTIMEEDNAPSSVSMLPIITSQRDRFRQRTLELESQLKKQALFVTDLKSKISKLEKDNKALFEKTRYLSSFKGSVNRNGNSYNNNSNSNMDVEGQYSQDYESSMHPLQKFREREEQRSLSRLSPLERLFISFTRAILTNHVTRMTFLGYIVGLHGLVGLMMIYVLGVMGPSVAEVGHSSSDSIRVH